MTGYKSKKATAQDKLAQQEPFGYLSIGDNPIFQKEKPEIGRWETVYTTLPQRTPMTDEHSYLIDALRTIAEGTYDAWSNGAEAQRTAIAAIEKYEAAHGIKEKNT